MRVFIVIPLIMIFFLPIQSEGSDKEKQIIVVFRYDDYSTLSSTEFEIRLINDLQRYRIPCTFGVIPFTISNHLNTSPQSDFPLSQAKTVLLKNAMKDGTVEIAQHGYSHQRISHKKIYSEFYGIDYDSQHRKIEKGKRFLEEIFHTEITTFIPPFNSYDLNTIKALEKLGFRCISSSLDGEATEFSKIRFLPKTSSLLQLQDAVKTARNISDPQPIVVVLFHEYDFLEIDKGRGRFTYQEFLAVLNWLASQRDVQVMTVKQANNMVSDLSATRFLMNRSAQQFIPPFLSNLGLNNSGLYFSLSASFERRLRNCIYILLFYFMILLISFAIFFYSGIIVFLKSGYLIPLLRYGVLSLLVFFSFYTFQDFDVGYKGVIALTMLCGACIGVWGAFFIMRRRTLR